MFEVLDDKIVYIDNNKVLAEVCFKYIGFNVVDLNHTYVDITLRGKGIASNLLEYTFTYFANNNIKVRCSCSYAKKWLEKHLEYKYLVIK